MPNVQGVPTIKKLYIGFSLLALIIGISLFIPYPSNCHITRTPQADLKLLVTALKIFALDTGRLPSEQEGLKILIENETVNIEGYDKQGYLMELPIDNWGNAYKYHCYKHQEHTQVCVVWTYGQDNLPGGIDQNTDVYDYGSRNI